jgi:hypothetical protein
MFAASLPLEYRTNPQTQLRLEQLFIRNTNAMAMNLRSNKGSSPRQFLILRQRRPLSRLVSVTLKYIADNTPEMTNPTYV